MRSTTCWIGVGLVAIGLSSLPVPQLAAASESVEVAAPVHSPLIPVLTGLRPQVDFWKDIFSRYSTRQVVIHDAWELSRVYEVLDFRSLEESGWSDGEIRAYGKEKAEIEKDRIRDILRHLAEVGPQASGLSDEERRIGALFPAALDGSQYLAAAEPDRLRSQAGLRERFAEGLQIARHYLPEMEHIFRREGLPAELTRLPLVESCFNVRAYSKVGAAGIWQFMPSTGRHFMRVDRAIDERRDPIVSTTAAAQFLRTNYEVLGNWPLAITAYNHGRAGVARAVETVGTDNLVDIIQNYHGPAFKFASRNFYAEFLAAVEAEREMSGYIDDLEPRQARRTEMVVVPGHSSLRTLARAANSDVESLANLNPALAPGVISGGVPVPKGFRLRVPAGRASVFRVQYASLAAAEQARARAHARQPRRHGKRTVVAKRAKHSPALVAAKRGSGKASLAARVSHRSGKARKTSQLRTAELTGRTDG